MIRRTPRSTHCISSAASDVYKRQSISCEGATHLLSTLLRTVCPTSSIYNSSSESYVYVYLFERSEFLVATSPPKNMCVCSTNLGLSGKKKLCVCSTNLGFSGGSANRCCCRTLRQYDTKYVSGMYYVPDTYVPGISRQTNVPPVDARTSDDSYMYQLSLVVPTATVSYVPGILS